MVLPEHQRNAENWNRAYRPAQCKKPGVTGLRIITITSQDVVGRLLETSTKKGEPLNLANHPMLPYMP